MRASGEVCWYEAEFLRMPEWCVSITRIEQEMAVDRLCSSYLLAS